MAKSTYTADDITVLEGLEPVRKRPAMYIGGTDQRGYHHLLWEIVDNAVDEVINGYASRISVTMHKDGRSITVTDNGRGIPVDTSKKFGGKSALEVILTTLHAGGKFEHKNYTHSGGLHGVGSSVVNALSSELVATVRRDGKEWEQSYSRGLARTKLKNSGKPVRGTGTTIFFRPDPDIFGAKLCFDTVLVRERLEAKTYLHKGLHVFFEDEATKEKLEFAHDGGIADYLTKIVTDRGKLVVPQGAPAFYVSRENGTKLEIAMAWTEATDEHVRSYVNGIPTGSGGTHDAGLRSGVVKAIRNYVGTHKLDPKGVTLTAEDLREGLVALVSLYIAEPQFQGQTKDRLNNPEVAAIVDGAVRTELENYLNANKQVAESLVARMILAARAREASRAANQAVSRKTAISHRLNLPGKLADCASTDPGESELFIVEGESAGGSAKGGRDRKRQAILPLRGKVLNVEQASSAKVLANKELQDIVQALGCGFGPDFDVSRLRYGKIFLLMDADSDGHHISTLLLTFFYRHMPGLIRAGHVYLAQPPLYKVDIGSQTYWALDEADRDRIIKEHTKGNAKPEVMRFKGLGEMNAEELRMTTLDPKRRQAMRVDISSEIETDRVFNELMGKDAQARFRLIKEIAPEAIELDV